MGPLVPLFRPLSILSTVTDFPDRDKFLDRAGASWYGRKSDGKSIELAV
jgi:hypothetical protein